MPHTKLGNYVLGRTLGEGCSCKVKLAKDGNDKRYAIKILNQDPAFLELIKTETDALSKLNHEGIVNLIEKNRGEMIHPSHGSKQVDYMVLELVNGGELFDFVANSGRFSEQVCRHYFQQFMKTLDYMHKEGLAHRDLKPENLMIDGDTFKLKIADFGFAAPVEGRDGSGYLQTQLGTASYMAPEIHLKKPYTGPGVDLFASAIILFIMLSERPPFAVPNPQDPHYRLLAANRPDLFWQVHDDFEGGPGFFTEDFKDLFVKMTKVNPAERLSMNDVLSHPWMSGPVPTTSQISSEFAQRKEKVTAAVSEARDARRAERAERRAGHVVRGEADGEAAQAEAEECKMWSEFAMEEYEPVVAKNTEFFTTSEAVPLFRDLLNYLRTNVGGAEPAISSNKWKVKVQVPHEGNPPVHVRLNLLRVSEQVICLEAVRKSGDQLQFFDFYKKLSEELKLYNDATATGSE